MNILCLNMLVCKDVIQSAGMLMASACLAQAMPPLEALTAAGFPEAAAREALQRVCGPSNPDHEPNPKPILLCAAELLATESVQPDAASLARMLAAAAESNQAGQPDQAGGSGRRSAAGAKRGSPGSSRRSKEEEAERRCAFAQKLYALLCCWLRLGAAQRAQSTAAWVPRSGQAATLQWRGLKVS